MKIIKLKCENCGATLEVNSELDKIQCSFCGAENLIDDDASELRRIEEVKLQVRKQNHEQELKERQEKLEQELKEKEIIKKANAKDKFKKSKTSKLLLLIFAIAIILIFMDINNTAKLFAILQAILALGAWLMGIEVIKEPFKGIRVIATVVVFILIFPILIYAAKDVGYKTIKWDYIILKDYLPEPDETKGRIVTNDDDGLYIYIKADEDDFRDYVNKCKEFGYTIDAENNTNSYKAKNKDDYEIKIYYYEYRGEYQIDLDKPYEPYIVTIPTNDDTTSNSNNKKEEKPSSNDNSKNNNSNNGLRSDFKNAMDSYEKFINEYVAFMKKYNANPSDYSLLSEYQTYMSKYNDMVNKFEKWKSENLNDTETKYYIEVQTRVNKKLAELI